MRFLWFRADKYVFAILTLGLYLTMSTLGFCEDASPSLSSPIKTVSSRPSSSDSGGARHSSGIAADSNYVLQVGDRVNIKVYPEDDYIKGGEMLVSSDGNVTLALVGKVRVEGLKVTEAEKKIAEIIDRDYLVNPEVVLEVLEFKEQSFVILGQVKKPGTYSFPPGVTHLTLLQAVSIAGGFSDIANTKKIKIVRNKDGQKNVIDANGDSIMSGDTQDVDLEPGDIIHVSESLF